MWLLLSVLLFITANVNADDDRAVLNVKSASSQASNHNYTQIGKWHFSVAFGYGFKNNPLVKGDDFPLLILPSVYYYGENLFFENGDLGYTLISHADYAVSAITRLNEEVVHFVDWHPSNILVTSFANDVNSVQKNASGDFGNDYLQPENNAISSPRKLSFQQLENRQWSLDAGIQLDWFLTDFSQIRLRLLTDASQVHYGENINLAYSAQHYFQNRWQINWSLGVDWLNQQLSQYYYGVDQRDTVDPTYFYQTNSALNPYIKVSPSYQINQTWRLVSLFKYQLLDNELQNSPIVKKKQRITWFVGLNYAF